VYVKNINNIFCIFFFLKPLYLENLFLFYSFKLATNHHTVIGLYAQPGAIIGATIVLKNTKEIHQDTTSILENRIIRNVKVRVHSPPPHTHTHTLIRMKAPPGLRLDVCHKKCVNVLFVILISSLYTKTSHLRLKCI
jgi:hypothetical protein